MILGMGDAGTSWDASDDRFKSAPHLLHPYNVIILDVNQFIICKNKQKTMDLTYVFFKKTTPFL
jgi:hypothetical protein